VGKNIHLNDRIKRSEMFFGKQDDYYGSNNELESLALGVHSTKKQIPELVMYCGKDDFLIEANRSFDNFHTKHAIPHQYFESDGGHTHPYANQKLLERS
jgi:putative tributyrin esterase